MSDAIPPLPPGFTLESKSGAMPPLPPGFTLERAALSMTAAPEAAPSWSQVPGQALGNILPSARQFAKGIYEAVSSPVQTIGTALDVGAGALRAAAPEGVRNFLDRIGSSPETTKRISDAASAAGGMLAERYGSEEALRRTIATDPVGVAGDLSLLLTGGGSAAARGGAMLSRAPGALGRAGEVAAAAGEAAGRAGQAVDPLMAAAKGVGALGRGVGVVGANVLGTTTGAGGAAIKEAARTGAEGGEAGRAFRAQMRGAEPVENVVAEAKIGLDAIKQARQAEYLQNMASVRSDPAVLDFTRIDRAISDSMSKAQFKGVTVNERAADALNEMAQAINQWKMLDPAEYHTPIGMDALKQKIGSIVEGIPFEQKRAAAIGREIYNALKKEIEQQAPSYSKAMADYSAASQLIEQIEKTFSQRPGASVDTQVRKLQSIMRNNVQAAYGYRTQLADALKRAGAENLDPMLAGQALSAAQPRGMQSLAAVLTGVGTAYTNPAFLPALAAASPRVVGETVHAGARAAGGAQRLVDALSQMPGARYTPSPMQAARYGAAIQRYQPQEQQP